MTTPAPAEAITEKWLLENGFEKVGSRQCSIPLSGHPYAVLLFTYFPPEHWRACLCQNGNTVVLSVVLTTKSDVPKLIEALTGKGWPCK